VSAVSNYQSGARDANLLVRGRLDAFDPRGAPTGG
jgi:hypothetical protein